LNHVETASDHVRLERPTNGPGRQLQHCVSRVSS
jgi:hypothetical protein